ncbi:hypothetical protein TNCV_3525651 [Trichonephila clavipes]|uniref:Uncharacterized protein n=1 Tax=Trichonephila clavipes TaxID=2585209 RepID=A0A8X6VBQ1_TRICX|nr:hypothetical protein TNCV_3525651 [Trichonephila clavipes]
MTRNLETRQTCIISSNCHGSTNQFGYELFKCTIIDRSSFKPHAHSCYVVDFTAQSLKPNLGTVNGLLMTGNMLIRLTSLVSNYMKRINALGFGDSLMNP